MACRPVFELLVPNETVASSLSFPAGTCLVRSLTTGAAVIADRSDSDHTAGSWIGIAADDKGRTGNTKIDYDPVGSSYLDSNGALVNLANGEFVGPKRALGDFQDETITNVTNLTAGSTGYEGPKRGVGVFTSPSTVLLTDQYVATAESTAATTDGTIAASGTITTNDLLTFGASGNKGKLVKLAAAAHGKAVAKVDAYDATAGILRITLL